MACGTCCAWVESLQAGPLWPKLTPEFATLKHRWQNVYKTHGKKDVTLVWVDPALGRSLGIFRAMTSSLSSSDDFALSKTTTKHPIRHPRILTTGCRPGPRHQIRTPLFLLG